MRVLFSHIDWEAAASDLKHLPSEIIGNVPDDWTNEQIEKDGDAVLLQLVGHFVNGFEYEILRPIPGEMEKLAELEQYLYDNHKEDGDCEIIAKGIEAFRRRIECGQTLQEVVIDFAETC